MIDVGDPRTAMNNGLGLVVPAMTKLTVGLSGP
jgi:hypothetical protein